jgi:phosphatidylglycerophosphate synthase
MALTHHDASRAGRRRLVALTGFGAAGEFAIAALLGALAVVPLAGIIFGFEALGRPALFIALGAYLVGAGIAGGFFRGHYPHDRMGLCNLVTLIRLTLASVLVAPLAAGLGPSWGIFVLAAVALSLDGIDGWLARRQNRVSAFGARFDMEVDSALALLLALLAWSAGSIGPAVVLLGLPRYAFAAAGLALPWLNDPRPDRFSRKVVCVLQLGTLIALQAPLMTHAVAWGLVAAAALALAWSFSRDVAWLWRARA